MPTLEDLDILKSQVNEMGDEPRIAAARGERIQDVAPPEASVDADLEGLLDDEPVGGDDGIADGIDEMEALIGSYAEDMESDDGDDAGFDAFDLDGLDPLDESGGAGDDGDLTL